MRDNPTGRRVSLVPLQPIVPPVSPKEGMNHFYLDKHTRTRTPLPGHTVTVAGISIYRVSDGRIVENCSADDLLGVLDQIDPCLL